MESQEVVPRLAWRWLGLSVAIMFLAIVIIIGLISAGTFDPKPIGELDSTYALDPVSLTSQEHYLSWPAQPTPAGNFTLRLIANHQEGELDSGYGLVIGEKANYVGIAVSPLGYLTIWIGETVDDQATIVETIIPWQIWPHVRLNEEENEIWLDIYEGQITAVRINRELLWQEALPVPDTQVGLWGESFGKPAEINFQQLELFTEPIE